MAQETGFLEKLLGKVPGSVYAFQLAPDGSSKLTYMSEGSADLYERPIAELLGNSSSTFENIHPDDLPTIQQTIGESARTLTRFRWLGRMVFEAGRTKWVRMTSMPEKQEDGAIVWYGTALDVTEEIEAQQQAQALREEQERQQALLRGVVDSLPVGVSVISSRGETVLTNKAGQQIAGLDETPSEMSGAAMLPEGFEVFLPDRVTPYPAEEMIHLRAFRGEIIEDAESFIRTTLRPEGIMIQASARPIKLPSGEHGVLLVTRDITQQRDMEEELRQRNRQLASGEEEKSQLVARLRYAIDELSNPILEVWDDVLAMPLIGVVDSRRTADMAQRLLAEVARTQAQWVIIDLTGVEVVDTKTADNLIKLVRKVELIGARCLLTGIRPSVAETVVEIGVEFAGLVTLRNLKHGLQEALKQNRRRHQPADREDREPRRRSRED
jgi:rsbT co-antagonist protein RsbR